MHKIRLFSRLGPAILKDFRKYAEALITALPGESGFLLREHRLSRCCAAFGSARIAPGCQFVGCETITIGNKVNFGHGGFFCAEGGAMEIGDETAFNSNVHINAAVGGRLVIGKKCLIGPNVLMRTANHRFDDLEVPIRSQGHIVNDIIIGDDCWIGGNAVVLGGVTLGAGCVVGAGAVVVRSIPAGMVAVGVPARVVKRRGNNRAGELI